MSTEKKGSCRPTMAEILQGIEPRDLLQGGDRNAQGAKGHRRGVGDQGQS